MSLSSFRLRCAQDVSYRRQKTVACTSFQRYFSIHTKVKNPSRTSSVATARTPSFSHSTEKQIPTAPTRQHGANVSTVSAPQGPLTMYDVVSIFKTRKTWLDGFVAASKALAQDISAQPPTAPGAQFQTRTAPFEDLLTFERRRENTAREQRHQYHKDFATPHELPKTDINCRRLKAVVDNLIPQIDPKYYVEFSVHVYNCKGSRAQAVRTREGCIMVQFDQKCVETSTTNSQLAWAAAHEIAHIVMDHTGKRRGYSYVDAEPLRLQHEFEADDLGLFMMARAGYDPIGAVEFLERAVRRDEKYFKLHPPRVYMPGHRTHPSDEERIARLRRRMGKAHKERREYEKIREVQRSVQEHALRATANAAKAAKAARMEDARVVEAQKKVHEETSKDAVQENEASPVQSKRRAPRQPVQPPAWLLTAAMKQKAGDSGALKQ